jgi:crossover junction endodeoxyribonuclease RuvC
MKILGIDPGYERIGFAIVEKGQKKDMVLFSFCLITERKKPHEERLFEIKKNLNEIIDKWKPEKIAIEKLFFNENQKTAMKVAEARGVIIAEAYDKKLEVMEIGPLEVKMAITGYGRSDKNQVKMMLEKISNINKIIKYDDEYDAIAIGITGLAINRQRVIHS